MRAPRAEAGAPGPSAGGDGRELALLRRKVDKLRRAQDQLSESLLHAEADRDRWADLYGRTPLPCLVMDGAGIVREMNQAAADLLGLSPQHARGRPVRVSLGRNARNTLFRHLAASRRDDNVVVGELVIKRSDGRLVPVEVRTVRLDGAEVLFASTMLDITDRLKADEERTLLLDRQLAARAHMEAKDQFIATLSHELRTPLTPVLAAVSALFARRQVPEALRGPLEMIQRNIVTEARLIDDLLDVARLQRGKLSVVREPMDVHDAAARAAEMLADEARKKGVTLIVALEAGRHRASGDPGRIRQVFANLIGNAIKFTPAGGEIAARSWNRDSLLAVEVSDTGMGIAPGALEHLFKPFEQGEHAGTPEAQTAGLGLGLAIASALMELHGGRIVGSSAGPGKGARFIVEIDTIAPVAPVAPIAPVAKEAAKPAEEPPTQAAAAGATSGQAPPPAAADAGAPPDSPFRVLLVEDHTDSAEMLADLLGSEGFEVKTAATAAAALASDLDSVDLVVSDIGLPDRSGHDLLRELRQRRPVPAIALSGYGAEADMRASREAGFSEHLTKPVDWCTLLEAIGRVRRRAAE